MRLKIGGRKGYVTRSTKLTIYEDAYEYAKSELLRLQQAAKLGHSLDEHTLEQHWRDWFERNIKNGTWTDSRQYWHDKYSIRYFQAVFQEQRRHEYAAERYYSKRCEWILGLAHRFLGQCRR